MVGATLVCPGRVAYTGPGLTYLGEFGGGTSSRTRELGRRLEAGGLECLVTDRVRSAAWSKLLNAAATMTLTVLPRLLLHAALSDPATSHAYVDLIREGAAIADRAGVALEDWPGMLPVESLRSLPAEQAAEIVSPRGRQEWRPQGSPTSQSRCFVQCRPDVGWNLNRCTATSTPKPIELGVASPAAETGSFDAGCYRPPDCRDDPGSLTRRPDYAGLHG